jgi:hypothetical protein
LVGLFALAFGFCDVATGEQRGLLRAGQRLLRLGLLQVVT